MAGKKRKDKKMLIFIVEIAILVIAIGAVLVFIALTGGFSKSETDESQGLFAQMWSSVKGVTDSSGNSPVITVLDSSELAIPEKVVKEAEEGTMKGYMNIALFGVDAKSESELIQGSRSDCIMIASINMDTGDIKLVSVYRDTYLYIRNIEQNGSFVEEYRKCNAAYSYGGGQMAVAMLNQNLDMNIDKYITVGYKGLMEVIDGLGGVMIDVDDVELLHINNYQSDIASTLKLKDYVPVEKTGLQRLSGLQACAYCRIRYGGGEDFKRTSRQREVLLAMQDEAKKAGFTTLLKVYEAAIGDIQTNINSDDVMELLSNIAKYNIVGQDGFPQENLRTIANIGAKGSSIIPMNLEKNVTWLHNYLFNDTSYQVSDRVTAINNQIINETTDYINKKSN